MTRGALPYIELTFYDLDADEAPLAQWSVGDGVIPRRGEAVRFEDDPRFYRVADVVHSESAISCIVEPFGPEPKAESEEA